MFNTSIRFSVIRSEIVRKLISFLFKIGSILSVAFFNMAVEAVQVGNQIKIPVNTRVYLDNGSNCEDYKPYEASYCTIGFGDTVEVLGMADYVVVLKYLPGPNHWEGKCESKIQTLCYSSESHIDLFLAYSSLEPEIKVVEEWEKPSKELLGDNHSSGVSEGQVFSVFSGYSTTRLLDVNLEFSMESIYYPLKTWILQGECFYFYGYRLKVVGFRGEYFAYVRLMEPENEKQTVNEGIYYNCPVGSLFQVPIQSLIETEVIYRESLKLREDWLKSFLASRLSYDLFDIPLTVDGLTVGQEVWFDPDSRGDRTRVKSIQNIDFDYLERLEESLEYDERSSSKKSGKIKSFVEDLNPLVFKTIPMINYWSCPLASSRFENFEGPDPLGHIIGFTEVDSGFLYIPSYSGFLTRYAIVENKSIYNHPKLCKFVLIPTSLLLNEVTMKIKGF